MTSERIDLRILQFFNYCEELSERTKHFGRPFYYQVNSHARGLPTNLRDQAERVIENAHRSGQSYNRTIFLMNLCPFAFGRSCAYGPKSS